ncbi:filamentous hemagglutinin N-terminal domain-containing protein [Helicobacter sp. 13S00477-4]|uniref:filamentous hemagglutinin N-terminal domain-containing protein n=1 Tax=Helicobacter sp. 13S00477-4 TaxID=1905759 RepID=UPI000BA51BF4|nr:filamentous hemagglutinin N-terminal domain-containing protein [Helicobacter sp. 13S00477-4]PAF52019.1 hypothetical protein BKH44_03860 [Helicobacter sp. 13S00477-4]
MIQIKKSPYILETKIQYLKDFVFKVFQMPIFFLYALSFCSILLAEPALIPTISPNEGIMPIIPDTSKAQFAPSIDTSTNNIPIINITAPNQIGISNNHYLDFNVNARGIIINNSIESITSTQLSGFITSNPNLSNSEANLILNQVTSTHSSILKGSLEIAGKQAGLIIANPNGITCQGCAFINTGDLTLSTGLITKNKSIPQSSIIPNPSRLAQLQDNQNLKHNFSLRVQKGHINIDSLNAFPSTSLNLLAKSLSIHQKLYAKELNIILGSNQISLDEKGALLLWQPIESKDITSKQEEFKLALDVAYLGGVYANSIYLIASCANSLIDNKGIMATFPSLKEGDGGFVIQSNGKIEITSAYIDNNYPNFSQNIYPVAFESIQSIGIEAKDNAPEPHFKYNRGFFASKDLSIQTYSLNNQSFIQSAGSILIKTQEELQNSGVIISKQNLKLSASTLSNIKGLIYAKDAFLIASNLYNQDKAFIISDNISMQAHTLFNDEAFIYATHSLDIQAANIHNKVKLKTQKILIEQTHITKGDWEGYDEDDEEDDTGELDPIRFLRDGDVDFERLVYEDRLDTAAYKPSS